MSKRKTNSRATSKKANRESPNTDHQAVINRYISDVQSGKIPAGRPLKKAIERHQKDLKKSRRRNYPFKFDAAAADHAINFFPLLKHTQGEFAGSPFILEPWQMLLIAILFGWRRKSDGLRRFRTAFLSIARGNGKSPLAAALALMLFCADSPREARAEVYCAATRKKQSRITWDEARRYVQQIPSLKKRVEIYDSTLGTRMLLDDESIMEVLEYSPSGHDGQITHAYICDELHAFRQQHRTLLDNLKTSTQKRRQPLGIYISTAGGDESELWEAEHEFAIKVVEGTVPAEDYFAAIFQLDEDDDIHDPKHWVKANPNLGISVNADALAAMSQKAEHDPETYRIFRRYHCNLKTSSLSKAISAELWAKGDQPLPALAGRPCHGGIDIGWRDDLSSFASVFPLDPPEAGEERRYAVKCLSWICEDGPRDLSIAPWPEWIERGMLQVTRGNTTDHNALIAEVAKAQRFYELRTIAADPSNARSILTDIENDLGIPTFGFFQASKKYNEPIREFLRALEEGRILHDGDPLLAWAAANLVTRADAADYLMPAKNKSPDKIDPIVAVFMSFSECLYADREGNAYSNEGEGVILF